MNNTTGVAEPASSDSSSVSSTLLDQLRSGRPEAWKRFVRLYSPVIYRWCRRSGLAAEDAADVFQEVLLAVMLHLADFRRDTQRDSFTAWLATITRNKVRDHYRRRHGQAEARGGTTAQRQLAEVPQPPEPSDEHIRPDAQSAAWLSQSALETDPGRVRAADLGRILAHGRRRPAPGPRCGRPADERAGGLHGQIAGPSPTAASHGRAAAVEYLLRNRIPSADSKIVLDSPSSAA